MKIRSFLIVKTFVLISAVFVLYGCGSDLGCTVRGNNVNGRIYFPAGTPVEAGSTIVVQYSEDSFTTIEKTETVWNLQGLVALPYSVCADQDSTFQVRAFQDSDGDGSYDVGEYAGRDDGTSSGHDGYLGRIIVSPSATDEDQWPTVGTADIYLDDATVQ